MVLGACGAEDAQPGDAADRLAMATDEGAGVDTVGPGATAPEDQATSGSTDGASSSSLSAGDYDPGQLFLPTSVPSASSTDVTPTTSGPATTTGGGGAPVTTVGGGGGGDVAIYQGVLGNLGRDQVVTAAVTAPPSTAAGVLPLTGLPGEVPNRPAAVVKIDNGSPARPQSGLNAADIVIEEEVEGGITRFA
ncbi:MAG: DUF3048 domain-containing protein, partial [Actinomycetota bacterium]